MEIAFFGSSLVSAYWNGAATYYRGLIRALAARGHQITFYEPDAFDRQKHRDMADPPWARVVVYAPDEASAARALEQASHAQVLVKASGVGVLDEFLEREVAQRSGSGVITVFWDVDAPATLARLDQHPGDRFHALVSAFDLVLTYGGGTPVVEAYEKRGARRCIPVYNALDPETHHPTIPDPRFRADLGFLGNRLPDREARVEEFFLRAAALLPGHRFVLGGAGWDDKPISANVRRVGHVYTRDHNAFNCTPLAVLNVSRDSMARNGWSPATRVFEAAGAGACLITDHWEGLSDFLDPGREILVAHDGAEVAEWLKRLDEPRTRAVGERARLRVLHEHTYAHRATQVETIFEGSDALRRRVSAPGR